MFIQQIKIRRMKNPHNLLDLHEFIINKLNELHKYFRDYICKIVIVYRRAKPAKFLLFALFVSSLEVMTYTSAR